jgi:endonuclease YncB( thermonuclease family)
VVGISDGDTVTVLDAGRTQHKVRLAGIDVPEKKQAFSEVSKQNLARLVFGKPVTVDYEKRDRYDRIVGKILVEGRDACLRQIQDGLAWHFKRYEQFPADRVAYAAAEERARAARRGLWREPYPWRLGSSERTGIIGGRGVGRSIRANPSFRSNRLRSCHYPNG